MTQQCSVCGEKRCQLHLFRINSAFNSKYCLKDLKHRGDMLRLAEERAVGGGGELLYLASALVTTWGKNVA